MELHPTNGTNIRSHTCRGNTHTHMRRTSRTCCCWGHRDRTPAHLRGACVCQRRHSPPPPPHAPAKPHTRGPSAAGSRAASPAQHARWKIPVYNCWNGCNCYSVSMLEQDALGPHMRGHSAGGFWAGNPAQHASFDQVCTLCQKKKRPCCASHAWPQRSRFFGRKAFTASQCSETTN